MYLGKDHITSFYGNGLVAIGKSESCLAQGALVMRRCMMAPDALDGRICDQLSVLDRITTDR